MKTLNAKDTSESRKTLIERLVSCKLDGTHGFIRKRGDVVTILNRNGIDYTRRIPELVAAAKQSPHDFTINGEIVYLSPKTGEIEFTPCQSLVAPIKR